MPFRLFDKVIVFYYSSIGAWNDALFLDEELSTKNPCSLRESEVAAKQPLCNSSQVRNKAANEKSLLDTLFSSPVVASSSTNATTSRAWMSFNIWSSVPFHDILQTPEKQYPNAGIGYPNQAVNPNFPNKLSMATHCRPHLSKYLSTTPFKVANLTLLCSANAITRSKTG